MVNEAAARPGMESLALKVSDVSVVSEEGVVSVVVVELHETKARIRIIYGSLFILATESDSLFVMSY